MQIPCLLPFWGAPVVALSAPGAVPRHGRGVPFLESAGGVPGEQSVPGRLGAPGEHPQGQGATGGVLGGGKFLKGNDRGNRFVFSLQSAGAQSQGFF